MDWYYVVDNQSDGPHSQDKIEALLRSGKLNRDTLVWRPSLDDWTPLGSVADFEHVLKSAATPPVLPDEPQSDRTQTSKEVSGSELPTAVPRIPVGANGKGGDDGVPNERDASGSFGGGTGAGHQSNTDTTASKSSAGRPWLRFFARQLDVCVMLMVVGLLFELSFPRLWKEAYDVMSNLNETVLGLILFPVAMLQNALVITMFGNSVGKALFGLRAVPPNGQRRFGLTGNVMRELRVWFGGYGLGIPLFALIAMALNYLKVRKGEPAIYDRNFADVEALPMTTARRAVGVAAGAMVLAGIAGLLVWSGVQVIKSENQLAQSETRAGDTTKSEMKATSWTNPVTGISTRLPEGWSHEVVKTSKGYRYDAFDAPDGSMTVNLAADRDVPESIDFEKYTKLLENAHSEKVRFESDWHQVGFDELSIIQRDGVRLIDNVTIAFLINKTGTTFWRITIHNFADAGKSKLVRTPIIRSLIETIRPPSSGSSTREPERSAQSKEQAVAGVSWTNPVTDLSTTLPTGWIAETKTTPEDVDLYAFRAREGSMTVYLAPDVTASYSLDAVRYTRILDESYAGEVLFTDEWSEISLGGAPVMRRNGTRLEDDLQLTLLLQQSGTTFWIVVVIRPTNVDENDLDWSPIVKSIMKTIRRPVSGSAAREREPPAQHKEQAVAAVSWTNPVTGLSTTLPAGWTNEVLKTSKGQRYDAFGSPDGWMTVYLIADRNIAESIDLVKYTQIFDKVHSEGIRFEGDWHQVSFEEVSIIQRDGLRLRDKARITHLLKKTGTTFWRIQIDSYASGRTKDISNTPVVKSLIRTIKQQLGGSSTREPERSARGKQQVAVGVSWANPVTDLSTTLPEGWVHSNDKSNSRTANFDFRAPGSLNSIRFAWHDKISDDASLLEQIKRIEEKFTKTALFDGGWERIWLDGPLVLQRSGSYRKSGKKFAVFIMLSGSGIWSIVVNNDERLKPNFGDAMPVVEALVQTLS